MTSKDSCSLSDKKVICPRCNHEFKPDPELVEQYEHKKEGNPELNVLASCPICGNKTRLEF